ncbi:MAG TPA: hypothetical protein VFT22_03120 [Kofleriaceae bacterium]|nr:hypothetical protein [Kofleriaceae bacterium]
MMPGRRARGLLGCAVALSAAGRLARAGEAADEGADAGALDVKAALRSTLVVARAPDDPVLFPQRDNATSLWRFRLMAGVRASDALRVDAAYEQRLVVWSGTPALAGLGVLPSDTPAPYRLIQLDGQVGAGASYAWRHELDRLSVAYRSSQLNATIGRQAVGWGRGTVFSAVDLFAPFSPLELDREWRRGIDAVSAELTLTPQLSTDAVAAVGEDLDSSTFAARVRGYRDAFDFELIGGWRARDVVAGVTSSAPVGDAELHGELAVFRAPEPLPAGGQLDDRVAIKALAGGSYRVGIGNGILVIAEYHYSGFGAPRARDVPGLLADPRFAARFTRGDTQILGRHAIALVGSYEASPELELGLRWLQSPVDGSGVATPTATARLSDRLAVLGALYVPYGAAPSGPELRSEYGATSLTGFVQLQASY